MGKLITIDSDMLINELLDTAPVGDDGNRWLTPFKRGVNAFDYLEEKIKACEIKPNAK